MVGGVCAGTSVTTSDKQAYAMGYCARHDADGDAQTIVWHMAPGAEKGEWKSIDGTGKYAGKKDSGWFQGVYGDGKISMVLWGGTCH